MLKVENIDVLRSSTHVLHDVSLEVNRGEIVALVGANGAGKTTTLRTISGFLKAKTGAILYEPNVKDKKMDLVGISPEKIVQSGVSHCPEGRGVFAELTVRENLVVGAYLRSDNEIDKDMQEVYAMFPILKDRSNQMAGNLSGGEQMMLALGRALMSRPKLLILDEPSLGLAPLIIEQIFEMLKNLNEEKGMTMLVVEQNASIALEFSHRAYVLETGRVVLEGESSELAKSSLVQEAYLGGV